MIALVVEEEESNKTGESVMEIIIGSIPPLPSQAKKLPEKSSGSIDAQLLHVRPPRKGIAGPSGRERRTKEASDPLRGRVLTIMVPDATQLPADIDTARYDVSIRLIRK
ncbi:MAG: hypothetical protein ACI8ZB_001221 [Desulforhopalus sp.]